MALGASQKAKLNAADQGAILAELPEIRSNWKRGSWLQPHNRYQLDPCSRLEDVVGRKKTVLHEHLREYVASSAITHCMDGWAFLGRAVGAELCGDPDASRHLGYYAELRAAMALLAVEGVGVFNVHHAVVNCRRRCECFGASGTHVFTWDALKHWASTASSAQLLLDIVRPGGISLKDWLDQFSPGPALQSILANEWLLQWGLDIRRLTEDRGARNFASYRPTAFTSPGASSISDSLALIKCLWQSCEPDGSGRFEVLDRHLLKGSLARAFKVAHSSHRTHVQARRQFDAQVGRMLHGLAPVGWGADQCRAFLKFKDGEAPPEILRLASGTADVYDLEHSRQVIARAMLLLRVATGASAILLKSLPGFTPAELQFWWLRLGSERGLWADGSPPAIFTDMWADVRDGLVAVAEWLSAVPIHQRSHARFWRDRPTEGSVLGMCERVGLWGLGL
jgi:hypothetical protein